MTQIKLLSFAIIVLFLASCKKEETPEPEPQPAVVVKSDHVISLEGNYSIYISGTYQDSNGDAQIYDSTYTDSLLGIGGDLMEVKMATGAIIRLEMQVNGDVLQKCVTTGDFMDNGGTWSIGAQTTFELNFNNFPCWHPYMENNGLMAVQATKL